MMPSHTLFPSSDETLDATIVWLAQQNLTWGASALRISTPPSDTSLLSQMQATVGFPIHRPEKRRKVDLDRLREEWNQKASFIA